MLNEIKIIIIFGGDSSEREVSLVSGSEINKALCDKYETELIEINPINCSTFINKIPNNGIVFNALHGGTGENGQIQSFLDQAKIIYTGSGATASMLAMNKHITKTICVENGISTANWSGLRLVDSNKVKKIISHDNKFGDKVIIKPNFQGSSIGISIADYNNIEEAVELAFMYSNEVLVEEYIKGREITVGILGNKTLPLVEIIPNQDYYNFDCKYTQGQSSYRVPADIDTDVEKKIKEDALSIYHLLGCRHYSRVDFLLDENNNHFLLEVNTLPGMTPSSLLPKAAESKGVDFDELVETILKIALIDNDKVL